VHRARRIVVGAGTPPHVPEQLEHLVGNAGTACHSSHYLSHRAALRRQRRVTVVGSGQSAAEIYLDLLEGIEEHGYELTWVTRSPRFFPLEYTKLTLELTSPEYSRYFHGLPEPTRDRLLASQRGLYKGISGDVIDRIHEALYRLHADRPSDRVQTRLLTNTTVTGGTCDGSAYRLDLHHDETATPMRVETDGLVLATGYRSALPDFLAPVHDRIRWDALGRPDVHPHYAIDHAGDEIFVQNHELHTHGFVAPDLGMGAYRSSVILARLLGEAPYPIEERVAFQEFGAPADLVAAARAEVPA
jgi:lysine N6-hydroxylase